MLDGYILCGTPRSGSTLLCNLLASTKVAGTPDSFFMREIDPMWIKEWGLPSRGGMSETDFNNAYLTAVVRAGKGGTEVFGLRLMRENLEELSGFLYKIFPQLPSDKARLEAAFGNILYLHLLREDKLAQAVSLVKAEQSGLWHSDPDGTELERTTPRREPEYDFDRIFREVEQLEQFDAAWISWFDQQNIKPFRVGYEILSANPAAELTRICSAIGVPAPHPDSLLPGVAKLSDAINADWMRRYRLELGTAASR
jgi:LPS sulfotransferase NodH